MDAWATTLASGGHYTGVAPLGNSLTEAQTAQFAVMGKPPIMATDADLARTPRRRTRLLAAHPTIAIARWGVASLETTLFEPPGVAMYRPPIGFTRLFRMLSIGIALALAGSALTAFSPIAVPTAQAAASGGSAATMADYWNGDAEWVYERRDSWTSTGIQGYYEGSSVRIGPSGTWYLFSRSKTPGVFCSMGIVVRSSANQGATWSAPVQVVNNTAGTPWSCAATDGNAYYNASANKWVMLFQCYDGTSWKGCYSERSGTSPMGAFVPRATPSVVGGQIWNYICDVMTDDCSSIPGAIHSVFDEGTFDIFQFDGTYYWVAFHGFDGVNGYRSIAKTTDFISWVAGNNAHGVPEDAIFDRNDSQTWRETWSASQSIGGGHGTIYKEGTQYYQLVEGADMNLACVDNQKWDFGLYRTTTLTSTSWTPIPSGNPILYSGRTPDEAGGTIAPCNIQYTSIFKDPSTGYIWMTYGRNSHVDQDTDALYWFRLEKTGNLLKNSDLWRADTNSFLRTGSGTNWAAWRIPGNSYDATPYLAMNCGGTCGSDNSVYQDVVFTPSGQTVVSASLKALLESGTGNISLAVWQLDSLGSVIKSDSYTVAANGSWKTYSLSGAMAANTKTLRFQMYLNGNATFRVDDLVLKAL